MAKPKAKPAKKVSVCGLGEGTHSLACECREAKFRKMEEGNSVLMVALENIVNVLGPRQAGACKENKCEGCKVEMEEALRVAKDALGAGKGKG